MGRYKRLFVALGLLGLLALGVGVYYEVGRVLIEAREATCSANLKVIGDKVAEFRATQQRFPASAAELVGLEHATLVDNFSEKEFVWTQEKPDGTKHVPLVWQPEPYRDAPWPFGQMRQLTLFSDLQIGDGLSEITAQIRGFIL